MMNTKVCENSGTKIYIPELVPESYRDVPDSIVNKAQKNPETPSLQRCFRINNVTLSI